MPTFQDAGKAIVTNRIIAAGTEPKFIAIGTGGTAENANQTALVTEVESRVSGTSSRVTITVTNDTYQVVGTIGPVGTARAVTESGLFDQLASGGNMLTRALFSVVNLAIGDSIQLTWQLKFTS